MKSTIRFTPTELAETLGAVLEANGYSPSTVSIKKSGELVDYDYVEVECELTELKVRCSPENSLHDQIQARQRHWMGYLTGQLPEPPQAEEVSNVENTTEDNGKVVPGN